MGLLLGACGETEEDNGTGGASGTGGGGTSGGGTSGAGATGGGEGKCEEICAEAKSKCPNGLSSDCATECNQLRSGGCAAEVDAVIECSRTRGSIVCDDDGDADLEGCDAETEMIEVCSSACVPSSDDSECQACLKTNCCDEAKAFMARPGAAEFTDCFGDCDGSSACETGCRSKHPEAAAAFDTVKTCADSNCPNCN